MKNHKFMWLISIMLVLSVFLAACGDKKEDAGTTEPEKDKEEDKGTTEEPARRCSTSSELD